MLKIFMPLLLLLATCLSVSAQTNMVPNGDFEYYSPCPSGFSQITNCNGWNMYTGGTPDYFNSCATSTICDVPTNNFGSENAASGSGYAGGYFYYISGTQHYREYINRTISALTPGMRYEVSMSVSLSDLSGLGATGLGVYFFDNGPAQLAGNGVVSLIPHIDYVSYGPIITQSGWERVVGYFTADSAYDNMVIGNFYSPSSVTTQNAGGSGNFAYYYIDSVVIKQLYKLSFSFADTVFCAADSLIVPFLANVDSFNTGNVFTLQLSNSSGNFASGTTALATITGRGGGTFRTVVPATITGSAGYRIRIVSSSPSYASSDNGKNISIGVVRPNKPVATSNSPACTADTLRLYATTSTTGTFSWQWRGPNNYTSTEQNPKRGTPATTTSGSYVVTVYSYGCAARDTEVVVVNTSPAAITASSNSAVCEQDTVKLYSTVSSSGVTYGWTGPNSFTSSVQNPIIPNAQMAAGGTYYVTATASNACYRKDSVTVTMKQKPFVSASNNGPACDAASIGLSANTSFTAATFLWDGPNAYASTAQNPTINPVATSHAGTYTVTTVLNGCIDTGVTTVVVNASPSLSVSSNSAVCLLDTIKLFSTASSGVSYSWTGPNSFSATTANPFVASASTTNEGYYRLTVTNSNGCTRTDSVNVTTKPLPTSSPSNTSPVCAGAPFSLNVTTSYTGVSFAWSGPNGFSSTSSNPTINNPGVNASGTYTLTATLNGCSYIATTNATVHPIPVAQAGAQLPVCVGGTMQLTGNSLAGATYQWNGPSYTSTSQSPSFPASSTTQSGNYILVITANGCVSEPDTVNVKVNVLSRIGGYASPNDTICQGAIPTFVAFVQDGGPAPVAQWYKNHSPIGNPNVLQYTPPTINNGDVYYCKLTAPGVCYTTLILYTDTIDMVVLPVITKPEVTITADPGLHVRPSDLVKFTANVKNGGTSPKYQWYKNGVKQTGAVTATYATSGLSYMDMIHVDIISEDPCAQDKNASDTVWMQFPAGVKDANKSGVKLYPNPNNGTFAITGIAANEADIEVVNAIGQIVYHERVVVKNNTILVDARLSAGVYQIWIGAEVLRFSVY